MDTPLGEMDVWEEASSKKSRNENDMIFKYSKFWKKKHAGTENLMIFKPLQQEEGFPKKK
jgi:hypothetical protein